MVLDRLRALVPVPRLRNGAPLVAVVRLEGVIGPRQSGPFRSAVNLAGLAGTLDKAFKLRGLKAVALQINSPGGSPVQSALVHDRIRALARERNVPVYAFAEDVAASGGYWLACAGDEIYASAESIVGSIGVIAAGFGFQDMLHKLGVERRLYTAGDKKSFLDPFRPEREQDVERLRALQAQIHDSFIQHVRNRRDGKLKGADQELFSGEFWTGRTALELGLIDGIGDLRGVMRAKYGDKVRLRLVAPSRGWLARRFRFTGGSLDVGAAADDLLASLEARALWSRFGL